MKPLTSRLCAWCSRELDTGGGRKYCSPLCRGRAQRSRRFAVVGVPSATVGAINELVVGTQLMRGGWHVFRAMSSACPYDLVATQKDRIVRIEVTTGKAGISGKLHGLKVGAFDHVAAVLPSGEVEWRPSSPSLGQRCTASVPPTLVAGGEPDAC